jgi:hypothetical protein
MYKLKQHKEQNSHLYWKQRSEKAKGAEGESINKFDSRHHDPKIWLATYELEAKAEKWGENEKFCNFIKYLTGLAEAWFTTECISESLTTWEQTKNAFILFFQREHSSKIANEKLLNRKQRGDEGIDQYISDILTLCMHTELRMSEEKKMQYILRGLQKSYKKKLLEIRPEAQPKNIYEFFQLLKMYEDTNYILTLKDSNLSTHQKKNVNGIEAKTAQRTPPFPCKTCKETGKINWHWHSKCPIKQERTLSRVRLRKTTEKPPYECNMCKARGQQSWHWHNECPYRQRNN